MSAQVILVKCVTSRSWSYLAATSFTLTLHLGPYVSHLNIIIWLFIHKSSGPKRQHMDIPLVWITFKSKYYAFSKLSHKKRNTSNVMVITIPNSHDLLPTDSLWHHHQQGHQVFTVLHKVLLLHQVTQVAGQQATTEREREIKCHCQDLDKTNQTGLQIHTLKFHKKGKHKPWKIKTRVNKFLSLFMWGRHC